MVYKSGRRYEGYWVNDLREGERGYENYSNGHVYKGWFEKGKPHGFGVYSWGIDSSQKYKGEWY